MHRHRDHNYFVYITTNPGKTTFYTGMTNDLSLRVQQHRENKGKKTTFAGKYYCYKLVYFERYPDVKMAIEREDEIKLMKREDKIKLIKSFNPTLNTINVFE